MRARGRITNWFFPSSIRISWISLEDTTAARQGVEPREMCVFSRLNRYSSLDASLMISCEMIHGVGTDHSENKTRVLFFSMNICIYTWRHIAPLHGNILAKNFLVNSIHLTKVTALRLCHTARISPFHCHFPFRHSLWSSLLYRPMPPSFHW